MVIQAAALTKRFGDVVALDGLTMEMPEGTVGLLGPNGAGKTTFLRLLLGLLKPTSGSATVMDLDCQARPLAIRERIGYMPEHDCLIPEMTGIGLVAYMARVSGLDTNTALGRAHDMLDFVGVGEERYRKVEEYSTGMKQRVKLGQALVHDPDLFLFDEPTAGLDPEGRSEMLELLKAISSMEGKSMLISSHLLPDVEDICRHVVIINGGQVVAQGDLKDLLSSELDTLKVRIRGDADAFLSALDQRGVEAQTKPSFIQVPKKEGVQELIFSAALETGVQIRYLGAESRSLEEVFLQIVEGGEAEW
ncbi:MAG: ABC transporter ATP-binding protein [Candidatus Thermoplasmatota archaeon]|nr:ABC transporter ATP-binding protein [Candidatus Thermoplasmatota archaeon]